MKGPWLKDRPAAPHKLLNAYVHRLAGFTPLDGGSAILREEPDVSPVAIGRFEWKKIAARASHYSGG
jgi:hypothetical protein